ncbi:uncharacterized protein MONBRDRAFT_32963 [Monosiga brevicollis MX1]|uniref:DH domain-containing protein n=1 Tax=Monosiga brevicollis TaxID=81824 RepID=A9V2S0_MONBE|nr:uncharacterized protein MONBRDRAFT_32963 [Monosiga brevicollis MX1]EDQ88061.1 predicted protein [Monosiga brevicollis MX1]|eukprot:XP_001747137.1 hypothetical protein [Monosiga brevicollis MX1]
MFRWRKRSSSSTLGTQRSTSMSSLGSVQSSQSRYSTASTVSRVTVAPALATIDGISASLERERLDTGTITSAPNVRTWETTVDAKVLARLSDLEISRQKVIYELIQTEQDYLRDLVIIRNLFRQPLVDQKVLSEQMITKIFSNLDELLAVNADLHERLIARRKKGLVKNVGEVFLDMLKHRRFQAYVQFCTNQGPACKLVEKLRRQHKGFAAAMRAAEQHVEEARGFDLTSFLLKGMQRLLKYGPLLTQILRYTPEDAHQERSQLSLSISLLDTFAKEVNAQASETELSERWEELKTALLSAGVEDVLVRELLASDTRLVLDELGTLIGDAGRSWPIRLLITTHALLVLDRETQLPAAGPGVEHVLIPHEVVREASLRASALEGSKQRSLLAVEYESPATSNSSGPTLSSKARFGLDAPRDRVQDDERFVLRIDFQLRSRAEMVLPRLLQVRRQREDDLIAQRQMAAVREGASLAARPATLDLVIRSTSHSSLVGPASSQASTIGPLGSPPPLLLEGEPAGRASSSVVDDAPTPVPDWEIEFTDEAETDAWDMYTMRNVRLVLGPFGFGMTLLGKRPVFIQDVEPDSPAARAGLRMGDAILSVNGQACEDMDHSQVIQLIKQALP